MPGAVESGLRRLMLGSYGLLIVTVACAAWASLATWSVHDPSLNNATRAMPRNVLGSWGAVVADLAIQSLGLASIILFPAARRLGLAPRLPYRARAQADAAPRLALPRSSCWPPPWPPCPSRKAGRYRTASAAFSAISSWPAAHVIGPFLPDAAVSFVAGIAFFVIGTMMLLFACGTSASRLIALWAPRSGAAGEWANAWLGAAMHYVMHAGGKLRRLFGRRRDADAADDEDFDESDDEEDWQEEARARRQRPHRAVLRTRADRRGISTRRGEDDDITSPNFRITRATRTEEEEAHRPVAQRAVGRAVRDAVDQTAAAGIPRGKARGVSDEVLQENARELEGVLQDFGVKGEITNVRPGPVVTLYELEPAPGTKSSRVIGLADDIARSMSAVAARVAVVPGRNAIGIELPNDRREIVMLRELIESADFQEADAKLALALGKNIGGEPIIVDLSRMPHLLIAGTTGSGKSVGINTMILSLLYRLSPEQCKFIMIDPKMLELSVYDGIPHLLAPVVTDPKKAVVALKWTVREMEERYKRMSKLGVRDIKGYNSRILHAEAKGEVLTRTVQTGFDRATGRAIYEQEEMDYDTMPYIVVIVDEMADLMMVAGKDIEAAVQRLGADGARRRHPPHHRHAAPERRRDHRHDQGELPDPGQLPGHLQDRQPHHSRRAGRRATARAGRHALYGRRRPHHARAWAVRRRRGGGEGRAPPEETGRAGVSRGRHRRGGRGRRGRRGRRRVWRLRQRALRPGRRHRAPRPQGVNKLHSAAARHRL